MNWTDERYVRVYTRDTTDWLGLSWEARSLFLLLLRKADRVGAIECGKSGTRGLAALAGVPPEVVDPALEELLADGCIEHSGTTLLFRNFIEAQEATQSPSLRQAESRRRRRDQLRAGIDPAQRGTVVYFVQAENGGPIKIGQSDDVARRLVNMQTSHPEKLVLLAAAPGVLADEGRVQARFAAVREKGEWFSPSAGLLAFIKQVAVTGKLPELTESPNVTCHEMGGVTPSCAVPSRAVLSRAVPIAPTESAAADTQVLEDPSLGPSPFGRGRALDEDSANRSLPGPTTIVGPARAKGVNPDVGPPSPEGGGTEGGVFRLEAQNAGEPKPRKLSPAENLREELRAMRSAALPGVVDDAELKPAALTATFERLSQEATARDTRVRDAYAAYLRDDYARSRNPPCPLPLFVDGNKFRECLSADLRAKGRGPPLTLVSSRKAGGYASLPEIEAQDFTVDPAVQEAP